MSELFPALSVKSKTSTFMSSITLIFAAFICLRNYFNTSRSNETAELGEAKPPNEPKTNPLKKNLIVITENYGYSNSIDDELSNEIDKENSAEEDEKKVENPNYFNKN